MHSVENLRLYVRDIVQEMTNQGKEANVRVHRNSSVSDPVNRCRESSEIEGYRVLYIT